MYRRKGLLDDIPQVRLIRGVVIVRTEDAGHVCRFLRTLGAKVIPRRVRLTVDDARSLGS